MALFSLGGQKEKSEGDYQVDWAAVDLRHAEEKRGKDPFFLPAEWYSQSGIQLTWPHAETDWVNMLEEVTNCFLHIAKEIAERELLLVIAPETQSVYKSLKEFGVNMENVRLLALPSNDTWARDHGALTMMGGEHPVLLDFCFNGWGEKYPSDKDNLITRRTYHGSVLHGELEDHSDFVLEGGSVESDGEGTILTTSSCLLAPHRNEGKSRVELEEYLLKTFHAKRILWLDHGGLEGDDTDGHIDTLARFCPNNTIVYVQCTDPTDSHYKELQAMECQLKEFRTLEGLPYNLLPLPMADAVYEEGERLPATYANFLILNGVVLYPTYNSPEKDMKAKRILREAFPYHILKGIDCRALIKYHGSLHCVTMQYPDGVLQ